MCLSTAYECAQTLSIHTILMQRRSEQYCIAPPIATCHYLFHTMTMMITRMTTMTIMTDDDDDNDADN
jgi:hypothetical protein